MNIEGYTLIECIYNRPEIQIFKAKRKIDGQIVALKICDLEENKIPYSNYRTDFYHINIVHCKAVSTVEYRKRKKRVFVLEWLEGLDLREYQFKGKEVTNNIILQILKGLTALHKYNIVHGDLKPENIIITRPNGVPIVKIIDYDSGIINKNKNFVTPEYCPPEFNKTFLSIYSDIWAAGCIIYELISDKILFKGASNAANITNEIKSHTINLSTLKSIPEPFKYICFRCLQTKPERRFKEISEIIDVLERKPTFLFRLKILYHYLAFN